MAEKKLYRSRTDRVLGGVCSGVGKFFDIDPVIVRLIWAASIFAAGTGVLLYIIAWIIIPEEPSRFKQTDPDFMDDDDEDFIDSEYNSTSGSYESEKKIKEQMEREKRSKLVLGIAVLIIGGFFLVSQLIPGGFPWRVAIGIILIVAGGAVLYKFFREEK
ncbi:MAG TPA: PspC domain-containing protein [Thermotogota bacterium]|nr:PspC domain-containing protein [Thermotogota bacterium]HPJ89551.1 PspC domain-containing protein [Thermotogota bacterium]HPR95764.1 PspC domain-containing protein [Thermotogota bacterium]